jgi:hypothetical protein
VACHDLPVVAPIGACRRQVAERIVCDARGYRRFCRRLSLVYMLRQQRLARGIDCAALQSRATHGHARRWLRPYAGHGTLCLSPHEPGIGFIGGIALIAHGWPPIRPMAPMLHRPRGDDEIAVRAVPMTALCYFRTRSGARVLVASSRTASKRRHHNKAQACTSDSNPEQLDGLLNDHLRAVYFNSNTDT